MILINRDVTCPCIFYVRTRRFLLTLNKIDILYLASLSLLSDTNFNKLSIKYHSYLKSKKVDAFEQNTCHMVIANYLLQCRLSAK